MSRPPSTVYHIEKRKAMVKANNERYWQRKAEAAQRQEKEGENGKGVRTDDAKAN